MNRSVDIAYYTEYSYDELPNKKDLLPMLVSQAIELEHIANIK